MTNVFSWIAICTGIAIIPAQLIIGIALFYNPKYTPEVWHYFLLYQAINGGVLLYNISLLKKSLWIYDVACELAEALKLLDISNSHSLCDSRKFLHHHHNMRSTVIT